MAMVESKPINRSALTRSVSLPRAFASVASEGLSGVAIADVQRCCSDRRLGAHTSRSDTRCCPMGIRAPHELN
jgi:hypothetical protein